jgi:hypothetical protein
LAALLTARALRGLVQSPAFTPVSGKFVDVTAQSGVDFLQQAPRSRS